MCQSGKCIYEDYNGDCTHEERGQAQGECPIMVHERKIKLLNAVLVNGQEKCENCLFNSICDREIDNYREDICQIIEKEYERIKGE